MSIGRFQRTLTTEPVVDPVPDTNAGQGVEAAPSTTPTIVDPDPAPVGPVGTEVVALHQVGNEESVG